MDTLKHPIRAVQDIARKTKVARKSALKWSCYELLDGLDTRICAVEGVCFETVNGSQLLDPVGSPVRLTGFNMNGGKLRGDDAAEMRRVLPGANVVRLVGLLWDNQEDRASDCMTDTPPFISENDA